MKNMVEEQVNCTKLEVRKRLIQGIQSNKKIKFVYRLDRQKELSTSVTSDMKSGNNRIMKFKIPDKITVESPFKISAKFFGSTRKGCLTMSIKDGTGKEKAWLPDPTTLDERNIGKLDLDGEYYSNEWIGKVETGHNLIAGEVTATMWMYTETDKNSRPIAFKHKKTMLMK